MIESVLADAKVIIYFKTRKKSAFFLTRSVFHHVNPTIDKRFSHTTSDRFQMHQRESSITTAFLLASNSVGMLFWQQYVPLTYAYFWNSRSHRTNRASIGKRQLLFYEIRFYLQHTSLENNAPLFLFYISTIISNTFNSHFLSLQISILHKYDYIDSL